MQAEIQTTRMLIEQTLYMQNCLFIMNYMADECVSFHVFCLGEVLKKTQWGDRECSQTSKYVMPGTSRRISLKFGTCVCKLKLNLLK